MQTLEKTESIYFVMKGRARPRPRCNRTLCNYTLFLVASFGMIVIGTNTNQNVNAQLFDCVDFNNTGSYRNNTLSACIESEPTMLDSLAVDYNNEGVDLIREKKFTLAVEKFDAALRIEPTMVSALGNKAFALTLLGSYDNAIKIIDSAVEIDPDNPFLFSSKGFTLLLKGDYQDAVTQFDKTLATQPDDIYALLNKADALVQLEEYNEALENIDKVLESNPTSLDALVIKITALIELQDYSQALEYADKVLEVDPNNSQVKEIRELLEDAQ